jgi:hypothetical protein
MPHCHQMGVGSDAFEGPCKTKVIFMHFTSQFPRDLPPNVKKFEEEMHVLKSLKIFKDLVTSWERSVICLFDPNFCRVFYREAFEDLSETVNC